MEKPITVARAELQQGIADLINGSGLPAFVIADVLTGFLQQASALEQRQLEADMKAWEEKKGNSSVTHQNAV